MGLFPVAPANGTEVINNKGTTFKYDDVDNKWYIVNDITVSNIAYDAGTWDDNGDAATKNAIRDKIESLTGLENISEDDTPQLGGSLDTAGNSINDDTGDDIVTINDALHVVGAITTDSTVDGVDIAAHDGGIVETYHDFSTLEFGDITNMAKYTDAEVESIITAEIVDGQSIDNAIDALISTHTSDDDAHHEVVIQSDLHTRSHVMNSTSDHQSTTANVILYANGTNDIIELPLGADTKVLKSNGPAVAPSWEDDNTGGAGGDTDAIHDNVADEITSITPKTALVDADEFILEDSEASFVKKAVTLANLQTSLGVSASSIASDDLVFSNDPEEIKTSITYTKIKQIDCYKNVAIRVYWQGRSVSALYSKQRIYINGIAVGAEKDTGGETYVAFTEDVEVAIGDTLEIWGYATIFDYSAARNCYARYMRIKFIDFIANDPL